MGFVKALHCRECGRQYPVEAANACDFCFGPLEVTYDYEAMGRVISRERIQKGPLSMWRYIDLLPVEGTEVNDLNTGFTPLVKSKRLGRYLGLNELYIKNDAVNPSYSFKDRVVSVASTKALEFGYDTLACASTGNLAGSVAAHAARAGMKAFIFVPADLEQGKMVGAAVYGPTLVAVKGNYDEVNRLCSELADTYHWAFVNINMRPYYAEGSKTLGYETAEQLGWRAPDHCIVPSASGSLFTKIYKGLHEFSKLGLIGSVKTQMHMAQAQGCAPIATAWINKLEVVKPVRPNTIAKSLAIGNPADGFYALKVIKDSEGSANIVHEDQIVEGIKMLAEMEGIFTETAGGVTISALAALARKGVIKKDDVTVVYVTGNGLKTQEAVVDLLRPLVIEPTVTAFQQALGGR
ncbi:MAG: threonine synthase [Dehalococcoidia bacterium]|nr:threonine synthase [Dehalococcoidia bacterium]